MHSKYYVTGSIANVEDMLQRDGARPLQIFGKKAGVRPHPVEYKPDIDVSKERSANLIHRYIQLIGVLRWAIDLERIDISTECSVLS